MALLKSDVPIREVVTTDPEKAKALENDVRAKIIDMLADEEMTIEGFMRNSSDGRGQGRDDGASPRERPEGRWDGRDRPARRGWRRHPEVLQIEYADVLLRLSPRAATRHSARRRNTQPRSW